MRSAVFSIGMLLGLASCGDGQSNSPTDSESAKTQASANESEASNESAIAWDLKSNGDGVELILGAAESPRLRLLCREGRNELLVNVPAFEPIGSEERLSFGGGGEVVALVADSGGDRERGGVSATTAVPDDLVALISGPVSASYGAQTSGPHETPPPQLAQAFAAACSGGETLPPPQPPTSDDAPVSACLTQGGKRIPANRLRAVGTEPFWGARIEGRCVTYSTPEDQQGTRIWTAFTGSPENGQWAGFLNDQRFVLRTRAQPGCSDGMSDIRYPISVTLTIGADRRRGCAEPGWARGQVRE